jgi:hypothetical protein
MNCIVFCHGSNIPLSLWNAGNFLCDWATLRFPRGNPLLVVFLLSWFIIIVIYVAGGGISIAAGIV